MANELYYYITWTQEDDALLTRIMESKLPRRTTLEKLFVEAAEQLNRTNKSVRNRWYKLQREKESPK